VNQLGHHMKVLLICAPSRAFGEVNSLVQLARSIVANGGEVWFLASPLAADVAKSHFPHRVFQMTPELDQNQIMFWRIVKKFRPDTIVLAELYEILRPRRKAECPFISPRWLYDTAELECNLVFVDFIAHVPMLRDIAECDFCSERFGRDSLRRFLERLWVILPCPLNEPGPIAGRCGIPYKAQSLPLAIEPAQRARVRARFMGEGNEADGVLVLRTGSSWQSILAEQYGLTLYERLGELFAAYLADLPNRTTLVSVSSRHQISCSSHSMQIHNIGNLPPNEFDLLVLSSDLVITDNEIGYTLAKTIGNVPSVVFVNTFTLDDVLRREAGDSPIRRIVLEMESRRRDSIYPHKIFPIPAGPEELSEHCPQHEGGVCAAPPAPMSNFRLGRMVSSPFVKVELYGGEETRAALEWVLCDRKARAEWKEQDRAYLERLNRLTDGVDVLSQLAMHESIAEHRAL
jgi:Family of unknown function (DUF6365)